MGSNAYISWWKVTEQPFIPQNAADIGALPTNSPRLTWIGPDGIYTGWIDAEKISAGTITGALIKTSSSMQNYIHMQNQYIDFCNDGLKKLRLGFDTAYGIPYMVWGAGDGGYGNVLEMFKNPYGFYMQFTTSNENSNGMAFRNNDSEYPNGAIRFEGNVDFSPATVTGIKARLG